MPRKVILHGDALKLLYTFLDYSVVQPDQMADAMNYDPIIFRLRIKQLERQIQAGTTVEWDELETALNRQERTLNDVLNW